MPDNIQLTLLVKPGDADQDELDLTTRRLCTELQDLPIDSVSLATAGDLPVGAKAVDPVSIGALTLSLAPIVVPALIELLKSWMARKEGRTVDRKSTRLNSSHIQKSRMPSSA